MADGAHHLPALRADTLVPGPAAGDEGRRLAAQAAAYAERSRSDSTRRAYHSRWRAFATWCDEHRAQALPAHPDVVVLYLTHLAESGRKVATIAQSLAAIAAAHREADLEPPASARLQEVWAGIRKTHGAPPVKKAPLTLRELKRVVGKLPDTLTGLRDRALLLLLFAAALRRSELAGLTLSPASLSIEPRGLIVRLAKSKTDQEGEGQTIAVPRGRTKLCAVAAVSAWLAAAEIRSGPVFRPIDRHGRIGEGAMSGHAVAEIVKRLAGRAGFDASLYSGHSGRRGFLTEAAERDVSLELMMKQARHAKAETTRGYIDEANLFRRNAAGRIGL